MMVSCNQNATRCNNIPMPLLTVNWIFPSYRRVSSVNKGRRPVTIALHAYAPRRDYVN